MKNNIEDFIAGHRGEFDDRAPSGKLWENLEVALDGKPKKKFIIRPFIKWGMAASVLLMVSAGIYFFTGRNNAGAETAVNTDTAFSNMATVPDEPEVNQFARMIAVKQEELKTLSKEQPELYRKFTTDINQLDSSYKVLKNQLSVTPNREMLIEAMIQNLQLQLNVLNQQLNIINQIKQSKKYSHEKNDQTI